MTIAIEQSKLLKAMSWNHLIILDACRYDYFSKVIYDYLDGYLIRAWSPASCTKDWLIKLWNQLHHLTYYSSTPLVNSKGVPAFGYIAKDHFSKIVDVWKHGWDEKLSTVPPQNVVFQVSEHLSKHLSKKSIIHFIQPHAPYIGKTKLVIPGLKADEHLRVGVDIAIINKVKSGEIKLEILRRAYMDNIKLALKYVALLNEFLEGVIIITSDHGEFLGERGMFLHPCGNNSKEVREIPWFITK